MLVTEVSFIESDLGNNIGVRFVLMQEGCLTYGLDSVVVFSAERIIVRVVVPGIEVVGCSDVSLRSSDLEESPSEVRIVLRINFGHWR